MSGPEKHRPRQWPALQSARIKTFAQDRVTLWLLFMEQIEGGVLPRLTKSEQHASLRGFESPGNSTDRPEGFAPMIWAFLCSPALPQALVDVLQVFTVLPTNPRSHHEL